MTYPWPSLRSSLTRLHMQCQAVQFHDEHALILAQRTIRDRRPHLAVHAYESAPVEIFHHRADTAHQILATAHHRALPRLDCETDHKNEKERTHRGEGGNDTVGNTVTRRLRLEQHDRTDDECEQTADAERAETQQQRLAHHEGDADRDQREPGVIDRQYLEGEQRQQQTIRADHARQHRTWTREIVNQAVDTLQHQHIGDIGIGDDREQPRTPIQHDFIDREIGRLYYALTAREREPATVDLRWRGRRGRRGGGRRARARRRGRRE